MKIKGSLRGKMLIVSVVPLLLLAVLVGLISVSTFRNTLYKNVEKSMMNQCAQLEILYDNMYPGEWTFIVQGDKYALMKGDLDLTMQYSLLDSIKASYDVEASIFRTDLCVQTTMRDEEGNRATLSQAAPQVAEDVVGKGSAKFYTDVDLNGGNYLVYFSPIINPDKSVFGMYAIYKDSKEVRAEARKAVLPIVIVILLSTVVIGAFSVAYSERIVGRLQRIQRFMKTLAGGRFNADLPDKLLGKNDELGDLARSGVATQKALSKLVEYDALTGLHNRRYGAMKMDQIKDNTALSKNGYCIGMVDIDFFKKVNDTYGHDAGDEVLRQVARVLKETMTGKGLVARWGGEEFIIAFDKLSMMDAAEVLLTMAKKIRALEIPWGDEIIKITMSMGIVQADKKATWDAMLKEADELLYYSKEHGRNQINIKDCSVPGKEMITYEKGEPRS